MIYETILVSQLGPVATITLNRPAALNALSRAMAPELDQAFRAVEDDPAIRVLLITGSPRPDGRPCFSAGADLKEGTLGEARPRGSLTAVLDAAHEYAIGAGPTRESPFSRVFTFLEAMRTPSIAVIDGVCTTGGLELALCCDLRIAGTGAQFSDVHAKRLGSIGLSGISTRLPKLVGAARAKELLWTGDPINAAEAYRIGLVNRVLPSNQLLPAAIRLANLIAERSPLALAASKAVVNASGHQGIQEGIRHSYLWSALLNREP